MNRRQFLSTLVVGTGALFMPRLAEAKGAPSSTCVIHPDQPLSRVPVDFIGLSYEANQLAHPDVFVDKNAGLVGHVRTLGDKGVLRIGGNSSEFTEWNPSADADLSDIALPFNADKKHRWFVVWFVLFVFFCFFFFSVVCLLF